MDRIKLVILITEYKYSCFAASKKLEIPYTNAKVIFRTFRVEGRVIQKERFFRPGGSNKSGKGKLTPRLMDSKKRCSKSNQANDEAVSIPSLDKDSDSLIREAIRQTSKVNADESDNPYVVPETINDIEVDPNLVN